MKPIRSLLFAPANRADLIAKFARIPADAFVLDLEDGVPPAERPAARAALPELYQRARAAAPAAWTLVRINAATSTDFELDCRALERAGVEAAVLPKAESAAEIAKLAARVPALIAGVETPRGVLAAQEIAASEGVTTLYFGAEDLIADLGGERTPSNQEVLYARAHVALAARAHGREALDLVTIDVRDEAQFEKDAREGRAMGYTGKMCITPRQIELANRAYRPTAQQIAFAERVVAAWQAGQDRGEGVVTVDERMIDTPLVRQAQSVLEAARRDDQGH